MSTKTYAAGMDNETKAQIYVLQQQVKENPFLYDAHVNLIGLYKQFGLVDELQQQREAMSSVFPLSLQLWRDWIEDAKQTARASDVQALYEKAFQDYLFPELWMDYLDFIEELDEDFSNGETTLSSVRDAYDQAISRLGCHVTMGRPIWEKYLEFEDKVFASDLCQGSHEKMVQQIERIRRLHHRQLSTPLEGLDDALEDYKEWHESVDSKTFAKDTHQKTLKCAERSKKELERRTSFESKLMGLPRSGMVDEDKAAVWRQYIDFEAKESLKKDPRRTPMLFERWIECAFLQPDAWLQYVQFLKQTTTKLAEKVFPVYQRAVRNCPLVLELWLGYVQTAELADVSALQKALDVLSVPVLQPEESVALAVAIVDAARRAAPPDQRASLSRTAFKLGKKQLNMIPSTEYEMSDESKQYVALAWPIAPPTLSAIPGLEYYRPPSSAHHSFYKALAHYEASEGNMDKARQSFEHLLKAYPRGVRAYLDYIELETEHKAFYESYKLYGRLLQHVPFSWHWTVYQVAFAWLAFEQRHGSADTLAKAERQIQDKFQKMSTFLEKAAVRAAATQKAQEKNREKVLARNAEKGIGKASKKRARASDTDVVDANSRNTESASDTAKAPPAKKVKRVEARPDAADAPEEEAAVAVSRPMEVDTDPASGSETKDESKDDQGVHPDRQNNMQPQRKTVFVLNIPLKVTVPELAELFSEAGGVLSVRIPKVQGKVKGFAYIELDSPESSKAAIKKLNGHNFKGRKLQVMPYQETKFKRGKEVEDGGETQKHTAYVKSLPKISAEDLEAQLKTKFEPCGTVKEVRIGKDFDGKVKGFAYIEFEDAESVQKAVALNKTPLTEGHKKTITVQEYLSKDKVQKLKAEKRKQQQEQKKEPKRKGRSKIKLNALSSSTDSQAAPASTDGEQAELANPKSNADFRALLFGKKK